MDALRFPVLDWIQVEATSHCNSSCVYCPRSLYGKAWPGRHMPLDAFRRLLPYLGKIRYVHLQGWGEPFLSPDFFEMIRLSRMSGCRVGTTTNGMLLDPLMAEKLVESGIDIVAFSLAGIDGYHDVIRKGTQLKMVLSGLENLRIARSRAGSSTPALHAAYMLFRSRLGDLGQIPEFLSRYGFDQGVISTLDFVPDSALQQESVVPENEAEYRDLRAQFDTAVVEGRSRDLPLDYHLPCPIGRYTGCAENAQRALFVASDGGISPCIFTSLNIPGASFWRHGRSQPWKCLTFGNIHEDRLAAVWYSKAYCEFRDSFASGNLHPPCRRCPKLL